MSTSRTTTIKFHKTVSSSLTGPTTIATFASTNIQPSVTVAAVLTEPSTTVTAYEIPGTTSLAVIDGTTLEWRHQGITLANGDVISIGFNGLEDKTTTASYGTLSVGSGTVSASESVSVSTSPSVSVFAGNGTVSVTTSVSVSTTPSVAITTLQGTRTRAQNTTGGGGAPTGGESGQSQSSGAASVSRVATGAAAVPTLAAEKTMALLGALGGMLVYGL